LAAADEALVIFFKLIGEIEIVGGDAEGGFEAVGAQVAEGVDALEARAVGEMEGGDGIVEAVLLARFGEIGQREALERRGENVAMRMRMLEEEEEGVHGIVALGGGVERASEIREQAGEAFAREAFFVVRATQGAGQTWKRRECGEGLQVGKFGGEFGDDLLDEEAAERDLA
jgi:hypothetical protein